MLQDEITTRCKCRSLAATRRSIKLLAQLLSGRPDALIFALLRRFLFLLLAALFLGLVIKADRARDVRNRCRQLLALLVLLALGLGLCSAGPSRLGHGSR